jgi:hypothetical protein
LSSKSFTVCLSLISSPFEFSKIKNQEENNTLKTEMEDLKQTIKILENSKGDDIKLKQTVKDLEDKIKNLENILEENNQQNQE